MPVKIQNFGGPLIWMLRKYHSDFTSKVMLNYVAKRYSRKIDPYITSFVSSEKTPLFLSVMFETINRCNGQCSFCPANVRDEQRPFKKMDSELFVNVIRQLKDMGWNGTIYLNINNEPLIDVRIISFAQHIRENLPQSTISMITNGTLLTTEKLDQMVPFFDSLIINDYSAHYALSENAKNIYRHIRSHKDRYRNFDIKINRRFSNEILATRAGAAPNKPVKNNRISNPCIYPFTDFPIFPDGKVGMCCNDCFESSDFGDLHTQTILEIWNGTKFNALRRAMVIGRDNYPACKECDVCDAGSREKLISESNFYSDNTSSS